MYDWYCRYYDALESSRANSAFCELVYGRDLSQHGFVDMRQLDGLILAAGITGDTLVLDLGCGTGGMTEYVTDRTGSSALGIDYVAEAIRQASERTASKRNQLGFRTLDISNVDESLGRFDVILALDSLYFTDVEETVRQLSSILRSGGRIAAYYSVSMRDYPDRASEILLPANTPLARAFLSSDLDFTWEDVTSADLAHARRRIEVLPGLEAAFANEGNQFIYDNRLAEALGVLDAVTAGTHKRYLYVARKA